MNVAAHLTRLALETPTRPALHVPRGRVHPNGPSIYTTLTFAELDAIVDGIAHGLTSVGVSRGVRVAVMVPPSVEFFALTFALLRVAAVPVLIDPGMGIKNLGICLGEAEPAAFIGIPKAHLARRLFGWAKASVRTTINVGRGRFFCHHALAQLRDTGMSHGRFTPPTVTASDSAAILFTSGSTGVAKGAVYTHGIFAAQVDMLKATYGIEPGEIDLCTFPLFALFGPALGMTGVVPDMDFTRPATLDPRKAIAQIEQFRITNLFGSPAVLRRLSEHLASHQEMPGTVRRIISAGAPASIPVLETLAKNLPEHCEIFTPYGATEALPVANIGSREILTETRTLTEQGHGVCVGRPVAGMTVHVIPISDEPIAEWDGSTCLPPGAVGEFVVRGPVVTKEYFHRPTATALAKIADRQTGEVLHRMGDVGYLDAHGRLWFCGRKSHRVVTPWGTLFTDMVEPIFNAVLDDVRTALVGVRRNDVVVPVLCVEFPRSPSVRHRWLWDAIQRTLRETAAKYDHLRRIETFLLHPSFPVDVRHNSKIFREKLAVWADRKLGPEWSPG